MLTIVRLFLSVFILMLFEINLNAQSIINAYAKVTGISGTTITLSDINESYDTFVSGEQIIIMQMQDNVIGLNTSNDSNFGALDNIQSAGLYEVATISTVAPSAITLTAALKNPYHTGSNSSLQIISFPDLGAGGDYATTSDLTAFAWNGNIGGIIALQVGGVLTLNHNVNVDGKGFRGGTVSGNDGTVACYASTWTTSNTGYAGEKGEGIYKITDANYGHGRAKIINGGGAGAIHNGGGGGGGNVTTGGEGGDGWNCSANPVGGQGGIALDSYITSGRIFMGGGGGGAHQNNSVGSSGVNGGGIILIKANEITTSGPCGGRIISANGINGNDSGNDGSGGAGAGGTIIFSVPKFSIDAACTLAVSASGGNGGSAITANIHGAGGGGGQGRIMFTVAQPGNTSVSTNNGSSGCNNDSNPCNSTPGQQPTGSNGQGVSDEIGSDPLPVSLLYFNGVIGKSGYVTLRWGTRSELNNDFYTLERSIDGSAWEVIGFKDGSGTTSEEQNYDYIDDSRGANALFYRLSQTDFNGRSEYLKTISLSNWEKNEMLLYPNPGKGKFALLITNQADEDNITIELFDIMGRMVKVEFLHTGNKVSFQLENEPKGVYMLKVRAGRKDSLLKLMLE
ncbi:T9SS type A sorting domain-containing protein [Fulvivirga sp. 29W222]|uniref:T9SS type A sorting domain-containing protein n=1 Tax=Fulvivirga marina TaxID=2494733 RepID=A0A937KER0_9BACT|nr:T9SS type A sorting domain-containing protein [Fulvivirga marina]MBL6447440.1 T9SS type A sorting domain-containing protein [Fulvivirga marina]